MIFTNNKSYQLHIDYPVYLLSGKNDAVGQFGKGISRAAPLLKKRGINKVEIKLFDNMHHDILHEQNYYDVYRFIEGKII